jgi:hypothetical protein
MQGNVLDFQSAPQAHKVNFMNAVNSSSTVTKPPVVSALRPAASPFTAFLATALLAAAVAALVVTVDQMLDVWAETHVLAAWLALWVVAVVAIAALRGASRLMAQQMMTGLDAWSAHVARRRADDRLWAMAQTDSRLMQDLQVAMDRSEDTQAPATDLSTYMTRRAARIVKNRLHYI